MKKQIPCPVCEGRGHVHWCNTANDTCSTGSKTCSHCNGTGLREVEATNADHIRSMTDEELVDFADVQIGCGADFFLCGSVCSGKCDAYDDKTCREKILAWLKQPYKEDST